MTEPSPSPILGSDPGRVIRCWTALFLRIGVGLSLLSTGLAGYFGQRNPMFSGGGPWGQSLPFGGLDPFFTALPYLAIGIGLALILGFLTTPSAIAAAFFSLIVPVFTIIQIISAGAAGGVNPGGRWGNDPFSSMLMSFLLPSLIPLAALIWLSPLENHPYSIDALIFGRNEIEEFARPQQPPQPQTESEPESTIHIGEEA